MNLGKEFLKVFMFRRGSKLPQGTPTKWFLNQEMKQSPLICQGTTREIKQYKCLISHTCLSSCSCSLRVLTMPSSAGISVSRCTEGRASSCFSRGSFNSACSLKFKELSSARYFFTKGIFLTTEIYCTFHLYILLPSKSNLNLLSDIL